MSRSRSPLHVLVTSTVLACSLSACVVAPPRAAGYRASYSAGVVLRAPPAPIVERYGVAPYPGYVWLGGYWNWVGERHVWAPDHWAAPRPGYRWVPQVWVRSGNGWRLREGRWARSR